MRFEAHQNRSSSLNCWDIFDREHPDEPRARNLLKNDAEILTHQLNEDEGIKEIGRSLRAEAGTDVR